MIDIDCHCKVCFQWFQIHTMSTIFPCNNLWHIKLYSTLNQQYCECQLYMSWFSDVSAGCAAANHSAA